MVSVCICPRCGTTTTKEVLQHSLGPAGLVRIYGAKILLVFSPSPSASLSVCISSAVFVSVRNNSSNSTLWVFLASADDDVNRRPAITRPLRCFMAVSSLPSRRRRRRRREKREGEMAFISIAKWGPKKKKMLSALCRDKP